MSFHPSILIAGVGQLGRAVGQRLLDRQQGQVVGISRSGRCPLAGLGMFPADLTRPLSPAISQRLNDVDQVIIALAPGQRDPDVYRQTYVEGVRHLLAALPTSLQRLIYVSSTVVYPQDDGSLVTEASETGGHNLRAEVQLEAEALCQAASDQAVILRLGGIYGPGREALIRRVQAGTPVAETPPYYTNRITQHDAARLIVHLLNPQTPAGCYLGVDHEPAPLHQVCDWLAQAMGLPAPPRCAGNSGGKQLSNQRVLDTGFTFDYPTWREGYGDLLARPE